MKNIKINGLVGMAFVALSISATDYDNAKFDNFIDGQGVNEVLEDAQFIICSLSRFGTEDLAGDGTYKATIYSDECEGAGAAATDSTAGTTAPTSSKTSSTTTSSGSTDATSTQKEVDTVIINSGFLTSTEQTTKAWIVNDTVWDERENRSPKSITYLLNKQSAAASSSNKFGTFTLLWQAATYGNKQSELPDWYECGDPTSQNYKNSWCTDGQDLGRGILQATGSSVKFKQNGLDGQQNLVSEFFENGNIAGVYSKSEGFQDDSLRNPDCDGIDGDWWECQSQAYRDSNTQVLGIFAFGIDDASKSYCTKMSALYKVDWSQYDEATDGPTLTPYTLSGAAGERLEARGWDVTEKCFSLAKSDAISDIWDYGVYNSDKSKYKPANQSFPIQTKVAVNDVQKNVHGYASYWGVHVDEAYQSYVTDSTSWTREGDNSDTPTTYNTKPRKLTIEKREKKFQALDELDGLSLNMWFNDSHWSDEFVKLGLPKVQPSEGAIKFKTNKAVFTDYNNGSSSDPLTYGLYGVHDGAGTYVANLVGGKIDKDNLRKIIRNDSNDPGKAMNLTMQFQDFPKWGDWKPQEYVVIFLCNGDFSSTAGFPTNFNQLSIATDSLCLRVSGQLIMSSEDGNELILSSKANEGYDASFIDTSSGTELSFSYQNWNQSGYEYDFKITKAGIERPAGMEIKLQSLFSAFGGLSQFDDNGGDISRGLESFLDSSSSFTFMISSWMNMYDHEGNRFNKVKGSFGVDATPPATVYVDDVKVNEPATSTASSFSVSLSKAQASAVTFDYVISSSSTASAADYTNLENGTVTIAAGANSSSIAFNIEADDIVEGSVDEKIILTLSNPSSNAVMGRTDATAYIYDDDTNRIVYEDYVGTYSAETSTFTITDGLLFNPSYTKTALPKPITFTNTQWLANMKKTYNVGTEWEETYYRDLNVWSQDTNQSYSISQNSMANTASSTRANGISTESYSRIDPSELPSSLHCIRNCLETSKLQAHYANVKSQADPAGDASYSGSVSSSSPSPMAAVGPYYKSTFSVETVYNAGTDYESKETREYTAGQYVDGILATNVFTYTVANGVISDPSGNELKIGVDWGIAYPSEKIRGANFANRDGWNEQTEWGIGSRELVDTATLAKLECDFTTVDSVKSYTGEQAEHKKNGKATDLRYCTQKLYSDDILVSYNLRAETYKQYEISKTDGSSVTFAQPKILYFTAPDDASTWGADAGKQFRLEMNGDYLGGIPGSVINIDTGEDLGEWVEEWNDSYRWVQRFVIPDGSVLTENTSDDTYLVKALGGQQWLGKKDSAVGSMNALLSLKSKSDLLNNTDINFEISNRESSDYECSLTKEVDDGNGGTRTETDWDACYAVDPDSAQYAEIWTLVRTYKNCQERIDYQTDRETANIEAQKAAAVAGGYEYTGPQRWQDMVAGSGFGDFADYINRDQARCKVIGDLPTSIINGGEPSVINGEVVFDPSPSS